VIRARTILALTSLLACLGGMLGCEVNLSGGTNTGRVITEGEGDVGGEGEGDGDGEGDGCNSVVPRQAADIRLGFIVGDGDTPFALCTSTAERTVTITTSANGAAPVADAVATNDVGRNCPWQVGFGLTGDIVVNFEVTGFVPDSVDVGTIEADSCGQPTITRTPGQIVLQPL
jgi:hypothetical protein